MFRAIGLVLSWLPVLVSVVTTIEQIMGSGNGEEKKKAATKAIHRVLEKAGVKVSGPVKTIISAVIDAIVAVLNILGVSGFSDVKVEEGEEVATTELLPASYAEETALETASAVVEWEDGSETPLETPEPSIKASPDEERMNDLQKILEDRIEDSTDQ